MAQSRRLERGVCWDYSAIDGPRAEPEESDYERKRMMSEERIPKNMRDTYDAIVALTDRMCAEHLNQEYADLSRKVAAMLARKRPSPLMSGKAASWAAGVVYAVGQMNFVFDKSEEPYLSAGDLAAAFGVSQQTAGNKAKQIRDGLRMRRFDHRWMLPSRIADSPMVWTVSVNGLIVDVRDMPREIQEEAYRKGIIPYIPDER